MRKLDCLLILSSIGLSGSAQAGDKQPTHIVLSDDYVVEGTVEGFPVSLIVDAATPDRPILNPEFVEKIKIKKTMIGGGFGVGPVKIYANTKVLKYKFGDLEWKRRSLWADRAYTEKYDGGVGPAGIPFDIVTLNYRPPQAGEKRYTLPLVRNGNSVFELEVGGKTIDITFTQKREPTLATAAAGAIIAKNNGGVFTGQGGTTEIAFGVERPIRAIRLTKPINIIGLSLDKFYVRTKDGGDSSSIVDGDLVSDAEDSNEIVVIGKKGKKDKNRYSITLGRKDLSHCSSITYDKIAKEIQLSCKPE